ncbi:peptidoglycan-binding domain-containing protein [Crinalium epipsammum]|uniref:peptidoglycan-binding domain-containing protein n=1 Tax=Crinalium epipsammum TaxID=241425 RepID=UPI00031A2DA0|nr:peptidoglycan-binding domain-containing protein [Crinalium epipsammum]
MSNPILRLGSKRESVKNLPNLLAITSDGNFGSKTEAVVKQFQHQSALVEDGIVSEETWNKERTLTNFTW